MTANASDFDGFYQAHYGETVAMTYSLTADLSESQDITQEAFARAWQRWKVVSTYDQPVTWVRRVATNLAVSRWRRLKVASAYLARERVTDLPDLSPDHVDVVAALRNLPVAQRKAVVLHYLVDLPVGEVAAELGVSEGTVKSWLHRGRKVLTAELSDEARRRVTAPPAGELRLKGDRARRLRRAAVTAAAAFAAVLLLIAGVQLFGRSGALPPLPPLESPSLSPRGPEPAAPTACAVERLPLPPGRGPNSYITGGDPTGRYLLGTSADADVHIWDNGRLSATFPLGEGQPVLMDINSAGVAVGKSEAPNGQRMQAWIYRGGRPTLLRGQSAMPLAINERNVIVGVVAERAAVWRTPESEPEFLPTPPGATSSLALGISEEGLILGFTRGQQNRTIVWYPDGAFTELTTPPGAQTMADFASGQIRGDWVGAIVAVDGNLRGALWNLRTGKSQVLELEGVRALNEHGWVGGILNNQPLIRTSSGVVVKMPIDIPGVSAYLPINVVEVLSDDGRHAGGQVQVVNDVEAASIAVRWTCQ